MHGPIKQLHPRVHCPWHWVLWQLSVSNLFIYQPPWCFQPNMHMPAKAGGARFCVPLKEVAFYIHMHACNSSIALHSINLAMYCQFLLQEFTHLTYCMIVLVHNSHAPLQLCGWGSFASASGDYILTIRVITFSLLGLNVESTSSWMPIPMAWWFLAQTCTEPIYVMNSTWYWQHSQYSLSWISLIPVAA